MQDKERQERHARRSMLLNKLENYAFDTKELGWSGSAVRVFEQEAVDAVLDYFGDHDITIALHAVQGRP